MIVATKQAHLQLLAFDDGSDEWSNTSLDLAAIRPPKVCSLRLYPVSMVDDDEVSTP